MTTPDEATVNTMKSTWGIDLELAICECCDWNFLLPEASLPQRCPHCFQAELTAWDGNLNDLPNTSTPEMVLPFSVSAIQLSNALQSFSGGIPFRSQDLTHNNLQSRLRRVYLPMWLVDVDVESTWQAEAGFDYQVVSHQDHFDQARGGWTSRQVNEGRIRWEPRLGNLKRRYCNIIAPDLDEVLNISKNYNLRQAIPYQSQLLEEAYVRLPDRSPLDAWTEAKPACQTLAVEECRQAASAQHLRQFQWQPDFKNQNWTLLLQPMFSTFYTDDDGKPVSVLVNGQSGQITGARRASMKTGKQAALGILTIAMVIFLVSLVVSALALAFPPLLVLGVIGLTAALLSGLGAVIPVARVWWFNHEQSRSTVEK